MKIFELIFTYTQLYVTGCMRQSVGGERVCDFNFYFISKVSKVIVNFMKKTPEWKKNTWKKTAQNVCTHLL